MPEYVKYAHYPAGKAALSYNVGDFVLTHGTGFISSCIRFGQDFRFRGEDRPFAYWNHAALVVSTEGDLVEALGKQGVWRTNISKYTNTQYTLVRTNISDADQAQILAFVAQTVGQGYGFTTDLSLGIRCLTNTKFSFGWNDQDICSGYVARAQERAGEYFGCFAENVMPADLAKHYNVVAPTTARP